MFNITKWTMRMPTFWRADHLVNTFGKNVVAFEIPIVEGEFAGYVDVVNMKSSLKDKLVEIDIPSGLKDKVDEIRNALNEAVAETIRTYDEVLDGQNLLLKKSHRSSPGIKDASIVPVFCGSAVNNKGVKILMNSIIDLMPSPVDVGTIKAKKVGKDET